MLKHILLSLAVMTVACNLSGQLRPDETATETVTQSAHPAVSSTIEPGDVEAMLVIAYIDDGDIWVIAANEPARRITSMDAVESIRITADSNKIAFLRRPDNETAPELYSIDRNGTNLTLLLSSAALNSLYPLDDYQFRSIYSMEFVPTTHTLLFNTRNIPIGPGLVLVNDLHQIDLDTSQHTVLFGPGEGGNFLLSPDGSQLALIQPDNIRLAQVDGSARSPNLLTYSPVMTASEFQYYAQPVWAADGSSLLVAIPGPDPFSDPSYGDIYRISIDSAHTDHIAHIEADFYFTQLFFDPVISPDLSHLIYRSGSPATENRALYLSGIDGSDPLLIESSPVHWRGWRTDSECLTFKLLGSDLYQLTNLSGETRPLVEGIDLRWIDSNTFLYVSGSHNDWQLRKSQLDGDDTLLASASSEFLHYIFTVVHAESNIPD